MASMYETIMDLPLFKGIGTEQLSLMLEKTSFDFLNLHKGELIADEETHVKYLDFILNGEVVVVHSLVNVPLKVKEIRGKGSVLGALRLFGIDTTSGCNAYAFEEVNLLRIGKEHYLNLLQSDRIYLYNYLNYLSAASQRQVFKTLERGNHSIQGVLESLVSTLVSPRAIAKGVVGTSQDLADFCGVSTDKFLTWKNEAEENGIIKTIEEEIFFKRI